MSWPLRKQYPRILSISASSKGLAFALLEGQITLVDWGVKSVKGDRNAQSVRKVKELMSHYKSEILVLERHSSKSKRSERVQTLTRELFKLAKRHNVSAEFVSWEQVSRCLSSNAEARKDDVAELIAKRFPDELGFRLPQKRKAWMSEDSRMGIFIAIALAIAARSVRNRGQQRTMGA
jgi:hypothetical protein